MESNQDNDEGQRLAGRSSVSVSVRAGRVHAPGGHRKEERNHEDRRERLDFEHVDPFTDVFHRLRDRPTRSRHPEHV